MKIVKHNIALFYVALILLFKVAGLHALTHHTDEPDIQHCEVCDITTAVNFIPLLEAEHPVIPQKETFFYEKKISQNTSYVFLGNRHLESYLFTRPPPSLL
ncbi:hypothetical protein [Pseudozobellia sp. WGM2]|uniref:hypothetical protein n=1 Tax=Pseudozobellia sp. WGM2 TaxID=2787625 RepID=UPI001AE0684D|nr:hypothetical protein [Pseudozobellia sp. WGM2]